MQGCTLLRSPLRPYLNLSFEASTTLATAQQPAQIQATAARNMKPIKAAAEPAPFSPLHGTNSCARARPWLNHNSNLWVFSLVNGEQYDNAVGVPHLSQMQDIDIISPSIPDVPHGDTNTDNLGLAANLTQAFEAVTTPETADTTAVPPHSAQDLQVNDMTGAQPHVQHSAMQVRSMHTLCSLHSYRNISVQRADLDLNSDLTSRTASGSAQIQDLAESLTKADKKRRACHQRADQLAAHTAQLETNLAAAKHQAAEAKEAAEAADSDYAQLTQQFDCWEEQLEDVLMVLQQAKRRRLT